MLQVRRVTTVKKGGKLMSFRAVVVCGNGEGKVGVGCSSAKEVRDCRPPLGRSSPKQGSP